MKVGSSSASSSRPYWSRGAAPMSPRANPGSRSTARPQRHDPDRPALVNHRQPPHPPLPHEPHCLTAYYAAYRARLDEAGEFMACACEACRLIGGLELKFVLLHYGDYVVQTVAGRQELFGPEVTISHLLLKNHVADLIGRSAYALVTESAVAHLELPMERAVPITEQYEHYAPVRACVLTFP
jgi:uncharacterized protein DUF2652